MVKFEFNASSITNNTKQRGFFVDVFVSKEAPYQFQKIFLWEYIRIHDR